jgi:aryl-alcohol dehydrogenase-like predicted oxidoreductase
MMHLESLICGQYQYNLIVRDVEREILPACEDQGMGFICWSPLASGMLTGKYKKADKPDPGSRVAIASKFTMPSFWHDRGFHIIEEIVKLAKRTGKSPAQLALSWLLHDSRSQLEDNLVSGDWDMPEEIWKKLDSASIFDHGYPRDWMELIYPRTFGDEEMLSRR